MKRYASRSVKRYSKRSYARRPSYRGKRGVYKKAKSSGRRTIRRRR